MLALIQSIQSLEVPFGHHFVDNFIQNFVHNYMNYLWNFIWNYGRNDVENGTSRLSYSQALSQTCTSTLRYRLAGPINTKAWKCNFGDHFRDHFGHHFGDDLRCYLPFISKLIVLRIYEFGDEFSCSSEIISEMMSGMILEIALLNHLRVHLQNRTSKLSYYHGFIWKNVGTGGRDELQWPSS